MAARTDSAAITRTPAKRPPARRRRALRQAGALAAALALVLLTGAGTSAAPAVTYRQIDLGTLGGQSSYATAINNRGTVVGGSQIADGTFHGFVWRHGRMTDLGLFSPLALNDRDQIVGTRDDVEGAFLWSRGRLVALGGRLSYPVAINNRGQVLAQQSVPDGPTRPALWFRGRVRALPLDSVSDLNDRGQIAGAKLDSTDGTNGIHASILWRGRITDLGAGPFNRSNTYRINAKGWAIGWMFSARQDERALLWRHGVGTDLGTLGGDSSTAVAINDHGVILLMSHLLGGAEHPALWRRGVLTDLAPAGVDGDLAGYNNRGEIAGSIRPVFGTAHAVIYRPQVRTRR